MVNLHWHDGGLDAVVTYTVESEIVREAPATILEREAKFVEREGPDEADE